MIRDRQDPIALRRWSDWAVWAGRRPAAIAVPEGLQQAQARPFFAKARGRGFEVHAEGGVTEIELYDEIGFWGVSAKEFREQLPARGDLRLYINSPGGDVFDGIAIFNDLIEHDGLVDVRITGLAASAASFIAMAGDRVVIEETAFMMIHNAWTLALGDRHVLHQVGDFLEQVDGAIAQTYVARSGLDRTAIGAAMDAETWYAGAEAVAAGLADAVKPLGERSREGTTEDRAAARFDLSGFRHVPEALRQKMAPQKDAAPTKRDLERALTQDAGLSRSQARALLSSGLPDVEATLDAGGDADLVAPLQALLTSMTEE